MLTGMAVEGNKRQAVRPVTPGHAIAARRKMLGLTAEAVVEHNPKQLNLKLLSQLENNHYDLTELRLSKLQALLEVLRWTPSEFEEATGVRPLVTDPLEGAEDFQPSIRIPVVGTVSAGLMGVDEYVEPEGHISIDPQLMPQIAGIPASRRVALRVNGDSMASDRASQEVKPGSLIVVEVGAIPRHGNLVVAWIPKREVVVVKEYREEPSAILRSYNPGGPVFRLGDEELEIRGVVRMIQRTLPS